MNRYLKAAATFLTVGCLLSPLMADQSQLQPVINAHDEVLPLDWPLLHVGTAEYAEGPTGVTVFYFQRKVLVAMDVLGGSPSSVNSSYLDLGYDEPELDAVVFAGGSWYGLEAVTAVSSALKDDHLRDGNAFGNPPNIALSVGSIIFDFGSRRLNEIYPDKRLAEAAFRAAQPGFFPLGAHGAGRMAKFGYFFGCNAFSGQGGAQRSVGALKIAAFAVVNAYGVITDRNGRVAACYPQASWPEDLHTADLMENFPASKDQQWKPPPRTAEAKKTNTTVSLVVVNQKLTPPELKRLAVQVHTSMSRAIQPFATLYDGDVLYAVSTAEVEQTELSGPELGVVASEVMWDAILAAVPQQPRFPERTETTEQAAIQNPAPALGTADTFQGEYRFSDIASLEITSSAGKWFARASGAVTVFGINKDQPVELQAVSAKEFTVPDRYPLILRFDGPDQLLLNPGHWQQLGKRVSVDG
ncbi:MAG: peptidase S58 DmpA [Xanthomonadales bacterium]|nr:peptidase S58 DmpA [Xanthomonadales bacterium]